MSFLEKPFQLLRRHAGKRVVSLGLPLALYVWTLGGPFCFDDLHLVLKTQEYMRGETTELGLFRFAPDQATWDELRTRGNYPWWSPQENRIDFFRPLAEWSFYLDMRLFGANPLGHRAVSLVLFGVVLLLLNRLYYEAGGDAVMAGAATLFFGVSQCVTQPVTFISNRADLLVLIGVGVSAIAYLRVIPAKRLAGELRGQGGLVWLVIGLAGFCFALGAKEIAIACAGVPIVAEFFRRWYAPSGGKRGWLLAFGLLLIAVAYAVWYAGFRSDSASSNSGANRAALLLQVPRSLPLYLSVWLLGLPINLLVAAPPYWVWIIAAIVLPLLALVIPPLVRTARTNFASVLFIVWTICFLGMALLTNPEVRALSAATVGCSYILATLLVPVADNPKSKIQNPKSLHPALRHWLFTTNFGISIACAIGIVLVSNHAEMQARAAIDGYLQQLKKPLKEGDALIVAQPQTRLELLAAADRLEMMSGLRDVSLVFLMLPNQTATAKRVNDRLITVGASVGPLIDSATMKLSMGRDYVPRVGDQYMTSLFEAIIERVANDEIMEMSFRFKRSLDDPSLHLLKIE